MVTSLAQNTDPKIDVSFDVSVALLDFATLANLVTNKLTDDDVHQKTASKTLKNVIDDIMKFNLSSDDMFNAAEIFAANRNKIDVFFSLPEQLRLSYVIRCLNSKLANAKIDDDDIRQKPAFEK
ncbi:hypothetical protein QVD17_21203 [Tagetes erecta]|uniref:MLLE-like domain-containing protein n=1 Tax=Tagetes erecta TaxID=13708 RepID=A0AAD8KMY2_TARER|nr:hypothetical protein QVD17_21203 [Tagetes erecta]